MNQDPTSWLYGLQHFGMKLGLDNIRALLELCDHPERRYRSILVGGTNGKGSVCAMLDAVLRAHGLATGMFSSPHLVRPNERIRLDGHDIETPALDDQLVELRSIVEAAVVGGRLETHPSFFEVIAATALCAFRRQRIDVALLEVGMGGRLDATNAVDADVSVVVTVDYDHVDKLGGTIESIAREKVAIARPGRPLVTGANQPPVLGVIRDHCVRSGSPLILAGEAALCEEANGSFAIHTARRRYPGLRVPLAGRHQRDNARVAIVALEQLECAGGVAVDPDAVRTGLAGTRWPGRLQWIDGNPPLLLDGAHNPAGARVLAEHLASLGSRRCVAVFGAMKKKAVNDMLGELAGRIDTLIVTRPGVERAEDAAELGEVARRHVDSLQILPAPADALARARELARPDGFVLVTGSLYLVGDVLGLLEQQPVPGPVSM